MSKRTLGQYAGKTPLALAGVHNGELSATDMRAWRPRTKAEKLAAIRRIKRKAKEEAAFRSESDELIDALTSSIEQGYYAVPPHDTSPSAA